MFEYKPAILTNTALYDGDSEIICTSFVGNGVYILNTQTGEMTRVFDTEGDKDSELLYSMTIRYKDCIFFIPWKAEKFLVYSRTENKWTEIFIEGGKRDEFYDACVYGDKIYLIGRVTRNVYCYSQSSASFECIKQICYEEVKLRYKRRAKETSKRVYWEHNGSVIHIYDIEENQWTLLNVPCVAVKEALYTGDQYCIVTDTDEIYVYDIADAGWKKIDMNVEGGIDSIHDMGTHIVVNYQNADKHVNIDKQTYKASEVTNDYYEPGYQYIFAEIDNGILMIMVYKMLSGGYVGQNDYFIIYNMMSGQATKLNISYTRRQEQIEYIMGYENKILDIISVCNQEVIESNNISLKGFLRWLDNKKSEGESEVSENSGVTIHKSISIL